MNLLITASECAPYVKIGGIADVIGSLPITLLKQGINVRVCIPYYKPLSDHPEYKVNKLSKVAENYIAFDGKNLKYEVFSITDKNGLVIYLIKNDDFISNGGIYYDPTLENIPNVESIRFALFSKIVAYHFTHIDEFVPDVIHANDWHTGAISQFIEKFKRNNTSFKKPKLVFTIHNLAYQGFTPKDVVRKIGLDSTSDKSIYWDLLDDNLDLLLQGIVGSDYITTVSETYAKEIQTPEYGEGLQDIINARANNIVGILNGIDTDVFNPESDQNIYKNYTKSEFSDGKLINKQKFLSEIGLENDKLPLFCVVSRLADQKGLDLICDIISNIIKLNANVVILGTGDPRIEETLTKFNNDKNLNKNFKAILKFSNQVAMNMYASADFFLVPSRFEPCGLTQMIAMRYGTIPIVRKTGGLADTVIDKNTGFVFKDYKSDKLFAKIKEAVNLYNNKSKLNKMIRSCLNQDFSWDLSGKKYIELYKKAIKID